MNKNQILSLLKGRTKFENLLDDLEVSDLVWNLQSAKKNEAVFYKMSESAQAIDVLLERANDSDYGLIIVDIVNPKIFQLENVLVVDYGKWLEVQKILSDHLYPINWSDYKFVAVTGTNGKTTTVELARQISDQMGTPSLSLGTLGVRCGDEIVSIDGLTTPPYFEIRKNLYRFREKFKVAFFEASSHALSQDRLYQIKFDSAAWTSFSQDHLDYHKDLDDYFESKCILIEHYLKDNAKIFVSEFEDALFVRLQKYEKLVRSKDKDIVDYSSLPPFYNQKFNRSNLQLALSLVDEVIGLDRQINFTKIETPAGRYNVLDYSGRNIVIDFAHTPDALENICAAIKDSLSQDRYLHVVFGCGGDRDRSKRSKMGAVVQKYANSMYVTSDNPRTESPEQIIDDILKGVDQTSESCSVVVDLDRKNAIAKAMEEIVRGDVLLIAGKGHEQYQIIGTTKYPYSDESVVKSIASKLGWK